MRGLVGLYGALTLLVVAVLIVARFRLLGATPVQAIISEALASGFGGLILSTLLMALIALLGAFAMTSARQLTPGPGRVLSIGFRKRRIGVQLPHAGPGFTARIGQSVILGIGAAIVCYCGWLYAPLSLAIPGAPPPDANALAAAAFALGFPALVSERAMAGFPEAQLPEQPGLRRLLILTTALLAIAGCLEILQAAGFTWAVWPMWIIAWVPVIVAVELGLRALARLFLPAPSAATAKAATDSMAADVLTRGPRAPAQLIRTHLGLDFSRSWALSYLSAALGPAIIVTAVFCWLLTGVKIINTGERGVYEQFGAPVAVYGSGLHVVLPWPLGQIHSVEFGTIHSVAAGTDEKSDPDQGISAEAVPPASLNRLWTTEHATQAQYLVADDSGGKQSFQTVNTEILVLYRTGLTDADALQAVYGVIDQETLVRQAASRLAVRYFGSRKLSDVMGAQRETLQETLRAEIAKDVATAKGGVEIVAVVIEEIHPPAGAAAAYHAVQAAEINAKASISAEVGRAETTSGAARSQALDLTDAAKATATETVQSATGEAYRFAADKRGYDLSPRSFLMERSFANLASSLSRAPLTLIDHRLNLSQGAILDLRSKAATNPSSPTDPATTVP